MNLFQLSLIINGKGDQEIKIWFGLEGTYTIAPVLGAALALHKVT